MYSDSMHHRYHHPDLEQSDDGPEGTRRRGRSRHGGHVGGRGFGPGGPRGFGPRGGSRRRRGAIRDAILSLLAEEPSNGYGLIRAIAERTDGTWTPSPGSVYPTLQQLVDEGLIEAIDTDGRTDFRLTDDGRAHVDAHAEEIQSAWDGVRSQSAAGGELRVATGALMGAARQVQMVGTPEQIARAVEHLDDARRALYRLLAD